MMSLFSVGLVYVVLFFVAYVADLRELVKNPKHYLNMILDQGAIDVFLNVEGVTILKSVSDSGIFSSRFFSPCDEK